MSLLAVEQLSVSYGDLRAVLEVSFAVDDGAVFVLLGANGAGKTSILRAISGLVAARSGKISMAGRSIGGLAPHQVARAGISHVPEGRRIFSHLSVEDNLIVSFLASRAPHSRNESLASVFALFPRLAERRRQAGGTLSGGEQQMLAIGRGLMAEPILLILDEPSLGLSPLLVEELFSLIVRINDDGVAILVVEQNVVQSLEVADRAYILAEGKFVISGPSSTVGSDPELKRAYLGM